MCAEHYVQCKMLGLAKCRQCAQESTKIISVHYHDNPVKLQRSTLPHRKTLGGQMCFRTQGFPDCRTAMVCKLQMMLQSLWGAPHNQRH